MDCLPQLHIAALHAQPGYQAATPGLGMLCAVDDWRGGLGMYRNSNADASAYAMAAWLPLALGLANLGAMAGAATGYAGGGIKPILGAVIEVPFSWGAVYLLLTPPHDGYKPAALALSFTFRI